MSSNRLSEHGVTIKMTEQSLSPHFHSSQDLLDILYSQLTIKFSTKKYLPPSSHVPLYNNYLTRLENGEKGILLISEGKVGFSC